MKIKLPTDKKKKRNLIITIVVILLLIGSCANHNENTNEESSSDSSISKMTETSEETTTTTQTEKTTEKVTTKSTTTTETTTTQSVTENNNETTDDIIECPDLLGKDFEEAVEMFSDIITIEKVGEDYHPYIAEGRIIEQDIKVFSDIKKGTSVKVKISLGQAPVETTPPEPVQPVETAPPAPAEPVVNIIHFVLNTESGCVHTDAGCSAAQKILPENYAEIDIPDNELSNYVNVYWACGKCSKSYSNSLPKF